MGAWAASHDFVHKSHTSAGPCRQAGHPPPARAGGRPGKRAVAGSLPRMTGPCHIRPPYRRVRGKTGRLHHTVPPVPWWRNHANRRGVFPLFPMFPTVLQNSKRIACPVALSYTRWQKQREQREQREHREQARPAGADGFVIQSVKSLSRRRRYFRQTL